MTDITTTTPTLESPDVIYKAKLIAELLRLQEDADEPDRDIYTDMIDFIRHAPVIPITGTGRVLCTCSGQHTGLYHHPV